MAKYEIERKIIAKNGSAILDTDKILSFRMNVKGCRNNYWYGFYDFESEEYLLLNDYCEEMHCLRLSCEGIESLDAFEDQVRERIYSYTDDWTELNEVADDYSCMKGMEWDE